MSSILYNRSDFHSFPGSGSYSTGNKRYRYETTSFMCAVGVGSRTIVCGKKSAPTHHFINGVHYIAPNNCDCNELMNTGSGFTFNGVPLVPMVLQAKEKLGEWIAEERPLNIITDYLGGDQREQAEELEERPAKRRKL